MSKLAVILVDDIYEDLELHYPRLRLKEEGFDVILVANEKNRVYKSKHQYEVKSTHTFNEVDPKNVKVLVVPGGYCPDKLRRHPECNQLVHDIFEAGAVVGFICHSGWVGVSAKILKGKKMTAISAIKDDLVNAGAIWSDEKCVVDGNLVSAQIPEDLPAFMQAIFKITGK